MAFGLTAILTTLVANKLGRVAEVVAEKGVEYVQDKLGVEIKPELTPEEAEAIRERASRDDEFRIGAAQAVATNESDNLTGRLVADMASDSWLSKNVRPISLLLVFFVYTVFAVGSAYGHSVRESYVQLLGEWGMLIFSFYFGSRGVEKVFEIINRKTS